MGERYVTAFLDWFRQPGHRAIALAAIDGDGSVGGYAVGAPLGYPRALSRHLIWISAAAVAARPWLVLESQFRSGLFERLRLVVSGTIPQRRELALPAPTMSLAAMGVRPDLRRKRIGSRLLEDFERRAVGLGMRAMRLSAQADNTAARKLYERSGWRLLSEAGETVYYFRTL